MFIDRNEAESRSPLTVEVARGDMVESRHLVDAVVADANSRLLRAHGEPGRIIFPRSAVKSLQALPLIECGAADAFDLSPAHVALACASHNGEPAQVDGVREMLARAGLSEADLECGAQRPRSRAEHERLAQNDAAPSALHNNCSGKHAGFLALAKHKGWPTAGYVKADHPAQRAVAKAMAETTGRPHQREAAAIDGCSIPTYPLPLQDLAIAFAHFGVGRSDVDARGGAMLRLRDACLAHPDMVAGKNRACTEIMKALGGRAFVKTGAEGVFVASLPERSLGVALKTLDGATRAADLAIAALIAELLPLSDAENATMRPLIRPTLRNWNGLNVGEARLVGFS